MVKKSNKTNVNSNNNKETRKNSSIKSPQLILNHSLIEHDSYNKQILKEINQVLSSQSTYIRKQVKKTTFKKVNIFKRTLLKIERFIDTRLIKDPKERIELDNLEKQVESTINVIKNKKQKIRNVIKFLKIPYKEQYKATDIDDLINIINNDTSSFEDILDALKLYKKRLTISIKNFYKIQKMQNPKYDALKEEEIKNEIDEDSIDKIIEQNEDLTFKLFKLLKANLEMTLFLDETHKHNMSSPIFIKFVKDLNEKLNDSKDKIGQEALERIKPEIVEEEKIKSAKKEYKKNKSKSIDEEIEQGNSDIKNALNNVTPKKHKSKTSNNKKSKKKTSKKKKK